MKDNKIFLQEIKARDSFMCYSCHSKKRLHVHHIKYRIDGGDDSYRNLITLCEECHSKEHVNKNRAEEFRSHTGKFEEPKGWDDLVKNSGYLLKSYRLSNETVSSLDELKNKTGLSYNLLFRKLLEHYGER